MGCTGAVDASPQSVRLRLVQVVGEIPPVRELGLSSNSSGRHCGSGDAGPARHPGDAAEVTRCDRGHAGAARRCGDTAWKLAELLEACSMTCGPAALSPNGMDFWPFSRQLGGPAALSLNRLCDLGSCFSCAGANCMDAVVSISKSCATWWGRRLGPSSLRHRSPGECADRLDGLEPGWSNCLPVWSSIGCCSTLASGCI